MNVKNVQNIILSETKRIKIYKKQYFQQHKENINEYNKKYVKNRLKTDAEFCLIVYTRNRIFKSIKGMTKQTSTRGILGIDIDTYRKWIEFQMTPDMTWDKIEIDHVKAFCMFDVSKEEELKEAFNWKYTEPLLEQDHLQKGTKYKILDCQLQFKKAYHFIKLNE